MVVPNKKPGRISNKPEQEILIKMYETMTAIEIAKRYNVTEGTVRRWIQDVRRDKY